MEKVLITLIVVLVAALGYILGLCFDEIPYVFLIGYLTGIATVETSIYLNRRFKNERNSNK